MTAATFLLSAPFLLVTLHCAIFRFDELRSLLLNSYSPTAAIVTEISLVGSLGCLFFGNRKHKTWSLPVLLILLRLLKRDLDINLLSEFSEAQLLDTIPPSSMKGSVVLITGASSGVGLSTTEAMASLGATVVLGCRSKTRCEAAAARVALAQAEAIGREGRGRIAPPPVPMTLDLASFSSIRSFAKEFRKRYKRLDILFLNAGFGMPPRNGVTKTEEGFELGLGVMHFGHFLLFRLLEKTIARTAAGAGRDTRVVLTSSAASQFTSMRPFFHESIYNEDGEGDLRGEITTTAKQYGRSKLANILFARELQKRMPQITTCSCHVGAVSTNIWESPFVSVQWLVDLYTDLAMRTSEEGRRTILKCALSQADVIVKSGAYLDGMGNVVPDEFLHPSSRDDKLAARLWEVSEMVTPEK